MQTPVRFYITQGDDQPVVRSIPVPQRAAIAPVLAAEPVVETTLAQTPPPSPIKNMAGIVKSAVKRSGGGK